jgi:hypothetical protein
MVVRDQGEGCSRQRNVPKWDAHLMGGRPKAKTIAVRGMFPNYQNLCSHKLMQAGDWLRVCDNEAVSLCVHGNPL